MSKSESQDIVAAGYLKSGGKKQMRFKKKWRVSFQGYGINLQKNKSQFLKRIMRSSIMPIHKIIEHLLSLSVVWNTEKRKHRPHPVVTPDSSVATVVVRGRTACIVL